MKRALIITALFTTPALAEAPFPTYGAYNNCAPTMFTFMSNCVDPARKPYPKTDIPVMRLKPPTTGALPPNAKLPPVPKSVRRPLIFPLPQKRIDI